MVGSRFPVIVPCLFSMRKRRHAGLLHDICRAVEPKLRINARLFENLDPYPSLVYDGLSAGKMIDWVGQLDQQFLRALHDPAAIWRIHA